MNPESISRKEILSISRQLLHKDKEIFIFSFFYIAWRVGAWVFLFWAMYTLLQPTSATKNMTPYALVLIFILISFFTSVIYAFYYALTVQCVGDRLQGEDPTFLSTLAKISSKWKTILKIYLKFFRPLPFKYFVLSGSVQEFLFQEILLNDKTYEEALERTASYINAAWARDLLFSLRWSALMIAFFLLGALIPGVGIVALVTKPISLLVSFYIVKVSFYATILYYVCYFVYKRALYQVYETVLYEKYVKNAVFEKTKYSLVIKVNDKEKSFPL